jgi:hypothetical protein
MTLNSGQRTALETELQLLEDDLRLIRDMIHKPPESGLLTRYRPVDPDRGAKIEKYVDKMAAEISILVEVFGIQPQTEDVGRIIRAHMASAWSELHDTRVSKLKRYGSADPGLERSLEPHILRLIQYTQRVEALVQEGESP